MDKQVITEFENIVGTENFISDKKKIESLTENTLNIKRNIYGIIYPENVEHVREIVKIANRNKVPLYPYSRARNIGYGERLPVTDDNLVVDMGSFQTMKAFGVRTIHDATHCVQMPGGLGKSTGGKRELIPALAKAAIAAGADGIFMEAHPNPQEALSDSTNQLPLTDVRALVAKLLEIREIVNE